MQEAETLLIRDAMPIIPLFYYVGFNYHDPKKIHGIYESVIDMHPLNGVWRTDTNGVEQTAAGRAKP